MKDQKDTKYLLIDCHAIAYAAMFTTGSFSHDGKGTGVIFGFLRKILSLAKKMNTNKFIFCWDSDPWIRSNDYPEYKSNRKNKEKTMKPKDYTHFLEMVAQREILKKEILPNMGFKNIHIVDGFESDDIIGYFATKLKDDAIIVSADNDFYQLLYDCSMYHLYRKKIYTYVDFIKEYNIEPDKWAMAKAIGGCNGDGVKGIKGVSDPKDPKSKALAYIRGELTSGKVFERIKSSPHLIELFYSLVKLPHEDFDKQLILRRDKITKKKMLNIFFKYEFKSFLETKNLSEWIKIFT